MAITNIKGRDVALFLEKAPGTYVRMKCASSVNLNITTEETEVSCVESGNFKEFEPGDTSWDGSLDGGVRQATAADAADNITAENLIDMQLAGTTFLVRFTLGEGTGAARYGGKVFITSNGTTGDRASAAALSTSFRGTGPLTKTLEP